MTDLSEFPINARWPAKDPSVIQLYSYPTPNGVKISIALEEMGLAYEPHLVTLADAGFFARPAVDKGRQIPAPS